jgi:hypothetical protein
MNTVLWTPPEVWFTKAMIYQQICHSVTGGKFVFVGATMKIVMTPLTSLNLLVS